MSTFEDRQRHYEQVDKPAAYRAHVAAGIRKRFAAEFDMSGLSDQDVLDRHYARFGAEMSPEEYRAKLDETYGSDFTPPEAPSKTFGDRASEFAHTATEHVKDFGEAMLPFVAAEGVKPLATKAAAAGSRLGVGVAKHLPVIGQAAFLAGHAANAAVDAATANQLAQTQEAIPVPQIDQLTEKYFQNLQTLRAKGYTDEQIRQEARRRAQNVMHGYEQTTDSLDQDVMRTQADASINEPARAATDAFFLGIGAPQIEKIVGNALAHVGLVPAAGGAVEAAAKPTVSALARIGSHVRSGVVVGTPGMAIQGAISEALHATAESKTPQEIGQALVHGALHGGKQGFIGGAIVGGGAGTLTEGLGAVTRPLAERAAANRAAVEEAARAASIDRTARDFNPHNTTIPLDGEPADIATAYIAQRHGDDAVLSEVGMRAASQIARNIELYREAENTLNPERPAPFQPPTQAIPRIEGLESAPAPLQTPPAPLELQGTQPEQPEQPNPAVRLAEPLGPVSNAAGVEHPTIEEPHPRVLNEKPAESPAAPPREVNLLAQHTVETYKKQHGFIDPEGRDMHPPIDKARAEAIAMEYHNLQNAKPGTPEFVAAKKSYKALNKEIARQFKAIKDDGFRIKFVDEDPYKNSAEMRADVRDNHRLKVFTSPPGHHPFMTPRQTGIFRAVHDFFGHAAEGFGFGQRGEEAAFRQHAATLSNDAIPALASETRGQNSWVNSFPENAKLPPKERPFAEQKFALMPRHTYEDVLHPETPQPDAEPAEPSAPPSGESVPEPSAPQAASSPTTPPAPSAAPSAPAEAAPAAGSSTPEAGPAPEQPPSRAQEALNTIGKLEHADVEPTPEGALRITRLSKVGKPGGTPGDLEAIVRAADQHGVSVETELTPPPGIRGGRIPLEKVIPWYEARGFHVVESERIPEGNLAKVKMVRDPIGELQNAVASSLEKAAADARARLNGKLGRANVGFDPSMIGDAAIELAADAFTKRLRGNDALAKWLVDRWGESVQPFIEKILKEHNKYFTRMFKTTDNADAQLKDLLDLRDSGRHGMDWYEMTANWAKERFGEDANMFLRFLAVTSANGSTEAGAELALKAFTQWKTGMPFAGFRSDSMDGQLMQVAANEPLTADSKIANFNDALQGDPNAVVLDRWMLEALNLQEKGGALRPIDYKIYAKVVRDLATEAGMSPRQFQAAIWEGARVGSAHERWKEAGPTAVSKIGSARPLEYLVERKLRGMTPKQYVDQSEGNLKTMGDMYRGIEPIRNSLVPIGGKKANGYNVVAGNPTQGTFDPESFQPVKHQGYSVPLVSRVVPRGELYPKEIFDFNKYNSTLLADLRARGLEPHLRIWRDPSEVNPTGDFRVDLSVSIPDKSKAIQLGKAANANQITLYGEDGTPREAVDTGYKGKPVVPADRSAKTLKPWHKERIDRVLNHLNKLNS